MLLEAMKIGLTYLFSKGLALYVLPISVIWIVVALLIAAALKWGEVLFHQVGGTYVLKLPGGGLLTAPPVVELVLLSVLSARYIFFVVGTPLWVVLMFLATITVARIVLTTVTHLLIAIGSHRAKKMGLEFSVECMDGRCDHGTRSGTFLHRWACGGWTLLTALGVSPLVWVPVFFGLPAGPLGWVVLALTMFPYFFVFSKLVAPRFKSDGLQMLFKGAPDVVMLTEWPGTIIGSLTASLFAWRPMPPGYSPTSLH
ncbi:hypothetical protein KC721_02535 [Candidatus Woesebacteria bacterium]|nr:hypothetical protein [Candidatus Woesebacteria bacterium]